MARGYGSECKAVNWMDDEHDIDPSTMPYDKWLSFVFDHPATDRFAINKKWYWSYYFEISRPFQMVEHFTRLCDQFGDVSKNYSLPQIDQGIWFVLGACLNFGQYLRSSEISVERRIACVRAMYRVFADFVSKSEVEVMENCFQMWWDLLLSDFYSYGNAELDPDAKEIENTALDVLTRILRLEDPRTQEYALHGLGHLKHPGAREVVARYIRAHGREWTEAGKAWLE